MTPKYDLNKIKFTTDAPTWEKAVELYRNGKVTGVKSDGIGYSAIVLGGDRYHVCVHASHHDRGLCDCYLGQQDVLCKHMVVLAIHAVLDGAPLPASDEKQHNEVVFSGRIGTLAEAELSSVKKQITEAMRYIKPYNGTSRTWFAYQDSLHEGVNRLSAIVSDLPVNRQTADLVVGLLLRVDKKLCTGGVDDSDGVVGGFIEDVVSMLKKYARLDPQCIEAFRKLEGKSTCFGWEESLLQMTKK